jgi:transcriptional regulator with PAS, ATPase and Fis domain
MVKKKTDWIDTPGLKHILEEEVPLAGKLLKKGKRHILVRGQTRTGKSHIRERIREASGLDPLKEAVLVNCAAISSNLMESELFGHKKGAFSGADRDKPGLLENKSDSPKIIFLEEIGELPKYLQAKLLVFLETGKFIPVGGTPKKSEVRIIATSNVPDKKFRPDFLARFWQVKVPSIHKRREDIPKFLEYFLNGDEKKLLPNEWFYLMTYNWPGGVSEIEDLCLKIQHYILTRENKQKHPLVSL